MDNMEITKDYSCPVCMEIMSKYVLLKTCAHKFCLDCNKNIKNNCPICRKEFTKQDLERKNDTEKLKKQKLKCACNKVFSVLEFIHHEDECEEINKTIEESKTNLLDKRKMKETVNRSTFACPCCKVKNLDRKSLVEHIGKKHPRNKAVCPICACQPWGNPEQKTQLASHMALRHKFDYDTYTDYDMNDNDILMKVIEQSLQEK